MERALDELLAAQQPGGSWAGDHRGCGFVVPIVVFALRLTGARAPPESDRLVKYVRKTQRPCGGWGTHEEGAATMLGSVLNYVALRLLGAPADDPQAASGRRFLQRHGGALMAPAWAKPFLAVLGLYEWRGVALPPPEALLALPDGLVWLHARLIALPLALLAADPPPPLPAGKAAALREEIFAQPYASVAWRWHRFSCAPSDLAVRVPLPTRALFHGLALAGELLPRRWRRAALRRARARVAAEARRCISPVQAALALLCGAAPPEVLRPFLSPESEAVLGYPLGARLWETALAAQALAEAGRRNAALCDFIEAQQLPDGSFPFSTALDGWGTADCTAEAVKALVSQGRQPPAGAAAFLRAHQNADGGFSSYERAAPRWVEALNVSQAFRDLVCDRSFVECTSSAVGALGLLGRPRGELLGGGADFLRRAQRPDGSWYGAWGVCFTYGTWFGVEGLLAAGAAPDDPALLRAAAFLRAHQNADGGWGEEHALDEYRFAESDCVQTAWAVLALLAVGDAGVGCAAEGGVAWLERNPRCKRRMAGAFAGGVGIEYPNYELIFPAWALARWSRWS